MTRGRSRAPDLPRADFDPARVKCAPRIGSPALCVKQGQSTEEPPTKSLEDEGDSTRGRPQITQSAGEPWDWTSTTVNTDLSGASSHAETPMPVFHPAVQGPGRP